MINYDRDDLKKWFSLSREERLKRILDGDSFIDNLKEVNDFSKYIIDDILSFDCAKKINKEIFFPLFQGLLKGRDNINLEKNIRYLYENHKDFLIDYFCRLTDCSEEFLAFSYYKEDRYYYLGAVNSFKGILREDIDKYRDICKEFARRGYFIVGDKYILTDKFKKELIKILVRSIKKFNSIKNFDLSKVNIESFGLYFSCNKNVKYLPKEFYKEREQKNIEYINNKFLKKDKKNFKAFELCDKINSFNKDYILKNKDNKEIILNACRENGNVYFYVSSELQKDPEILFEACKQNINIFKYLLNDLKNNRDICLEVCKKDGRLLKNISNNLKKDKDICIAAVNNYGLALKWVDEELKRDEDIIVCAIKQNGLALEFVKEEDKSRLLCLFAIEGNGLALKFVPKKLKDYNMCYRAIRKNGFALEFVSDNFKDYKLCFEACKNLKHNYNIFKFIDNSLKSREDFIIDILRVQSFNFKVNKRNHCLEFILNNLGESLLKNKNICLEFCKISNWALKYFDKELKKDKELMTLVIENNNKCFKYIDDYLKKDFDICLLAVNKDGLNLKYIDKKNINKFICIEAIKNNRYAMEFIPEEFKADRDICLEYIKNCKNNYDLIEYGIDIKIFYNDKEIMHYINKIEKNSNIEKREFFN